MVGSIKSWRGDLHEWNFNRRASIGFIDYIAVQEPEHDPFEENDEFALVSCLGPTNTTGLEEGSSELLRDELACVWTSTNTLVVGGSVYFSDSDSRVAPNNAGKHRRVSQFTEIFLQVQIGSFAYRRCCRLGFKYSLLHQTTETYTTNRGLGVTIRKMSLPAWQKRHYLPPSS
jgi:hypothetical protein